MKPDRFTGTTLVIGAAGGVITMALHPVGSGPERIAQQAGMIVGVHALAIVSITLQGFGFLRFTRLIRERRALADAGLVAFALAVITGSLAAAVSGLLTPHMAAHALQADDAAQPAWRVAFAYNFMLNGVLSNVFITATSVAIALWSLALVRTGTRWTALGTFGVVVAVAAVGALFTGRLRHNVHDVGLFVFATSAWIVALGALLCRGRGAAPLRPAAASP